MMSIRIGFGYDVHKLAEGYKLWLGGILIPGDFGAVGHSDADVLLHAICDALLGAAALGDIGKHFPDTDPAYKGIDSKILLMKVVELISNKKYRIVNIDSTVVLQFPKIAPFIEKIRQSIADVAQIPADAVSVKATTSEKLGFTGRGEGIEAYANVLISAV
jgi:2-C-methyl-D-erythritol 2,4-cyclodiphosphate synthase